MIEGIENNLLRKYVETRRKIHQDKKTIYAISSIFAIFSNMDNDRVVVDPHALGHLNELMSTAVLNMWETLDDFIPIVRAELCLNELEKENKRITS